MRILRIYPFLPPMLGGMEKHVLRLTEEQRKLGCEVILIFNQGHPSVKGDLQVLPNFNLRNIKPQVLRDFLFYTAVAFKVFMHSIKTDVIHVHGDWSAFFFARLVVWLSGARVGVASLHGVAKRGVWRYLYYFILRKYKVIYTTGRADSEYFRSCGLINARVQNSGIEMGFFEGSRIENPIVDVIVVSNFFPVKNLGLVVEIASAMPETSFLLVGDGPMKAEIVDKSKELSNVSFTGTLSPQDVSHKLRTAKVFLSTSSSEGTPTAMLEAMASGLVVVTSRSNDYSALIKSGLNGYVVDGFLATNYVTKLKEILLSDSLQNLISNRNKLESKKNAWPEVAKRITDWMQSP